MKILARFERVGRYVFAIWSHGELVQSETLIAEAYSLEEAETLLQALEHLTKLRSSQAPTRSRRER